MSVYSDQRFYDDSKGPEPETHGEAVEWALRWKQRAEKAEAELRKIAEGVCRIADDFDLSGDIIDQAREISGR